MITKIGAAAIQRFLKKSRKSEVIAAMPFFGIDADPHRNHEPIRSHRGIRATNFSVVIQFQIGLTISPDWINCSFNHLSVNNGRGQIRRFAGDSLIYK